MGVHVSDSSLNDEQWEGSVQELGGGVCVQMSWSHMSF